MQKTSQNASDVASFAKRVKDLTDMLEKATDIFKDEAGENTHMSQAMKTRIERMSKYVSLQSSTTIAVSPSNVANLIRVWVECAKKVQDIGARNYGKRLIARESDADDIAGEINKIIWSIRSFSV